MRFFRRIWKSLRVHYEPLVEVRIIRDRLLENYRFFEKRVFPALVAPVLKSNAYGHGLYEVAHIFENENLPFIVVDSYYEALMLRYDGVTVPILVIGFTPLATLQVARSRHTSYTLISIEEARGLAVSLSRPTTLHIKIDTGMHRQGIAPYELEETLSLLAQNPLIYVEGLCSHFADADGVEETFTNAQIKLWNECVALAKQRAPSIRYFHIGNTRGTRFAAQCDANVVRVGIGLFDETLEMRTQIASICEVKIGEKIGYNGTFVASHPMKLATIPVGYYEGVDRRLSNKGSVEVGGVMCPIVGRVSMNITIVDVSSFSDAHIGGSVSVISSDSTKKNSIIQMAKECDTIPYELLVHIPSQLRRIVV